MLPSDPDAAYFSRMIDHLVRGRGVTRTLLAMEAGMPPGGEPLSYLSVPRLSLCLRGTARYHIRKGSGTTEIAVGPGECLFMPPNCGMMPIRGSSYQSLGVLFHPDFTRFLLGECKPSHDPSSWHRFKRSYHCPHVLDGQATSLLGILLSNESPLLRNRLLEVIFLSAQQLLERPGNASGSGKAGFTYQAARQFIDEHFHQPITREDVARHLHVHANHISRLFAKKHTAGFNAYVRDLRLKKAESLLDSPSMNISEIALACGFANAGYFARCYRQKYGRTPSHNRSNP